MATGKLLPSKLDVANNTDIDENNIRTSNEAASSNKLASRIQVMKTDPNDELIPLEKLETKMYVPSYPTDRS